MGKKLKKDFDVFFSWQSDLTTTENRNYIKNSIEKAIKKIPGINFNLIESTDGSRGSVDIAAQILENIDRSDIFLADVSIINRGTKKFRKVPNPNVLLEMGYASKCMGWERIICFFNENTGRKEDLPFDFRHRNVLGYKYSNEEEQKEREMFVGRIKNALSKISINYESILYKTDKDKAIEHDKRIFSKADKIFDQNIINWLEHNFLGKYYEDKHFDAMCKFLEYFKITANQFLSKKINEKLQVLLEDIDEITLFMASNNDVEEGNSEVKTIGRIRDWRKREKYYEKIMTDGLFPLLDKLKESYTNYRETIKRELFV